jgi:DNA-directed RNA polymerase beta subunit
MDDGEILTKAGMMREGVHMASPVFDGAKEEEIKKCLAKAGLPVTGQAVCTTAGPVCPLINRSPSGCSTS